MEPRTFDLLRKSDWWSHVKLMMHDSVQVISLRLWSESFEEPIEEPTNVYKGFNEYQDKFYSDIRELLFGTGYYIIYFSYERIVIALNSSQMEVQIEGAEIPVTITLRKP